MAEQPMLKFVSVDRDMPTKRDAELRNLDFDEIYAEYAAKKAEEQASRCSQCGVPYCQTHCPLHNNMTFILLELLFQTNSTLTRGIYNSKTFQLNRESKVRFKDGLLE